MNKKSLDGAAPLPDRSSPPAISPEQAVEKTDTDESIARLARAMEDLEPGAGDIFTKLGLVPSSAKTQQSNAPLPKPATDEPPARRCSIAASDVAKEAFGEAEAGAANVEERTENVAGDAIPVATQKSDAPSSLDDRAQEAKGPWPWLKRFANGLVRIAKATREFFTVNAYRSMAKVRTHDAGGMPNIGNTCYMNSTFQALHHSGYLQELLESDGAKGLEEGSPQKALADSLAQLQGQLRAGDKPVSYFQMREIYTKLNDCGWPESGRDHFCQEDATEFVTFLEKVLTGGRDGQIPFVEHKGRVGSIHTQEAPGSALRLPIKEVSVQAGIKSYFKGEAEYRPVPTDNPEDLEKAALLDASTGEKLEKSELDGSKPIYRLELYEKSDGDRRFMAKRWQPMVVNDEGNLKEHGACIHDPEELSSEERVVYCEDTKYGADGLEAKSIPELSDVDLDTVLTPEPNYSERRSISCAVDKFPTTLPIQLGRINDYRQKDASPVNLSPKIEVPFTDSEGKQYIAELELSTVIIHKGASPKLGHYTCGLRNPDKTISDGSVEKGIDHDFESKNAWLLMYTRTNVRPA